MRLDHFSQGSPARRPRLAVRPCASLLLALVAIAGLSMLSAGVAAAQPPAQPPQEHAAAGAQAESAHGEAEHAEGALPTIARVFNFAALAGVLFYFLRTPIATYLTSRSSQIRQDLVTAADMRAEASTQLARIAEKMKTLPAELDALRARGAEDVVAERGRIARAAAEERERLLAHTRREIDMQLRMARRALVEHGAQLAVDVAHARIVRTITPEDQLRLVDRYAAQLKGAR